MIKEPQKTPRRLLLLKIWLSLFVGIVAVMTFFGLVTNVPKNPPYPLMVFICSITTATILLCLWMFIRWFVRWLFCWRNLRRALVGLAGLATLIAIFYTVENWRGKRAWENYKRDAESKGVVLDWNTYIPPTVPADQNFFGAPKMAEWFIRSGFTEAQKNTNEFRARLGSNTNRTIEITTETAARDYLAWSEKLESDFDTIRNALERPYSRMSGDYSQPFAIPIPDFITVRMVAQTLSHRAKSHLLIGEPEKALHELTLMRDLCRLLENRPTGKPMTLVAAMINVAITGLYVETFAHGLRLQAWQEPELAAIQKQLQQINLIPIVASAFDFERVASCHAFETITANELNKILRSKSENLWETMKDPMFFLLTFAPKGWIYQNIITHAKLVDKSINAFDSTNQLILPRKQAEAAIALEKTISHLSPYNYITSISVPNSAKAAQILAQNQTKANQATIICALERYRLAHGTFPDTLDALAPQFMENIPHDIIGGQPLKYRRTDDGKFLLYSIGWNEKDDGGTPGKTVNDNEHGDWVWPISWK